MMNDSPTSFFNKVWDFLCQVTGGKIYDNLHDTEKDIIFVHKRNRPFCVLLYVQN